MTSKEALDKLEKETMNFWYIGETLVDLSKCHISQDTALKQIRDYMRAGDIVRYKDLDLIKKDLEVLEIIKNNLYIHENDECLHLHIDLDDKEVIDKIKEWLNND